MDRREFLRLSTRGRERVLELSCERLYTRYVDARAAADMEQPAAEQDVADWEWAGEPPLDLVLPSTQDVFVELERRLAEVQVLRVAGREWLAVDDFRREVEPRIEAFRLGGGRVE